MKEINWKKLWKLPEDLKKRIVKGKTPHSKERGEISEWIGISLNRLDTHDEMRAIAKQLHPSTKYEDFNPAVTAYLQSSEEIRRKVQEGKIHILTLADTKKIEELPAEDSKNIIRYNNAKEVQKGLSLFYKDMKYFLESDVEDREYLRKFLSADKINYIASLLSCIRDEELLRAFMKHQGVRGEL